MDDRSGESQLLDTENLPLDLGKLGTVTQADLVIPGVYEAVLENYEMGLGVEAFIVLQDAADISETAKQYGKADPDHPGFLVYSEDETGNTQYIIYYELARYKILHHLPIPEGEDLQSIAAFGREMYPGYFGGYPVPRLTPWGVTTRNKIIANGLFWLETEQCRRGLAVAYPKYDDLSDGARGLAVQFDDGLAYTEEQMPGYLFFREEDSCVPVYELSSVIPKEQLCCGINRFALMNAVYQYHPEYAALHNLTEQAGRNASAELLLQMLDIEIELNSPPERLISLTSQVGTEFITF